MAGAVWRKSSYSNQAGGDCVEMADGFPGLVPVRDSKNALGPALAFPAGSWTSFIGALQQNRRFRSGRQ
ncbi:MULTISPECIES: DUF397 domain-containing protein [Streptomyces]|uniref:DUF397 domain-containing protein n=1 Tax=Streptomyces TaxID=1883 RepID=UPI001F59EF85|nr:MULTISPECIES: DUF397 domain-containing protein [unclassified Streptomyces]MDX3064632.1 DUF397 domain-containing protein [Streptomyces sp. ND04-05B]WRY86716.1 DUF397 domain-containing protein [Streptomyces clavifer]